LFIVFAHGQEGNPFDLEHKTNSSQIWNTKSKVDLPSADVLDDTLANTITEAPINPAFDLDQVEGNPFEIGGTKQRVDVIKAPPPVTPKPKIVLGEGEKSKITQFKVGLSILLMIAMALISTLLRHVIVKVVEGFRSDNLLRTYFRNIGRRVSFPIFLLEIFFVINAAFCCFLIYDYLDLLFIGSKFLSTNRFHFFMYLCTVEIAPLFILLKVINNSIGS